MDRWLIVIKGSVATVVEYGTVYIMFSQGMKIMDTTSASMGSCTLLKDRVIQFFCIFYWLS